MIKMEIDKNYKPLKLPWAIRWAPAVFLAGALTYAVLSGFREGWKQASKPNLETKVVSVEDNADFMTKYIKSEQKTKLNPNAYKTEDFSQDSDKVLLARLLFGEARNCNRNEKIAVAYTVINRVNDGKKWNGENIREVILKPWQYSCFNKKDVNLEKLKNPLYYSEKYFNYNGMAFEECLEVAEEVLDGKYSELNKGQTHYFNPKTANPSWKDKLEKIGKIGNSKHEFYRED